MSFSAVILAGTRPGGDALSAELDVAHKGLIELEGRPLLSRVTDAVGEGGAQHIAVVCDEGPVADLARANAARVIAPGAGPSESVLNAFDTLGAPLLVTTADHALLRPEWVRQIVMDSAPDSDVSVMLARREAVERALPGSKRTYLRFADGHWSGCNLFFLRTPNARRAIGLWQRVEADRKRPWRLAARLGMGTLLDYALGRLALADGVRRLGRRNGFSAQLVSAQDGLAAIDVDTPRDLEDVRRLLQRETTM